MSSPNTAGSPIFQQVTSEINHEIFAVLYTAGTSYASVLFEAFDSEGNQIAFPELATYSVGVSNDAYDESRQGDLYSFYNVEIKKEDWIKLYDINLPQQHLVGNFFSLETVPLSSPNPLTFKYVRFLCSSIIDTKVRITLSAR